MFVKGGRILGSAQRPSGHHRGRTGVMIFQLFGVKVLYAMHAHVCPVQAIGGWDGAVMTAICH